MAFSPPSPSHVDCLQSPALRRASFLSGWPLSESHNAGKCYLRRNPLHFQNSRSWTPGFGGLAPFAVLRVSRHPARQPARALFDLDDWALQRLTGGALVFDQAFRLRGRPRLRRPFLGGRPTRFGLLTRVAVVVRFAGASTVHPALRRRSMASTNSRTSVSFRFIEFFHISAKR
jgi:hypothetical protein